MELKRAHTHSRNCSEEERDRAQVVMDRLKDEVRQESLWTMMFVDDIVICGESSEQVEKSLERWRYTLERRGMKVSRRKTEYMCVNERGGSGVVRLQGEEVEKVEKFRYLGSTVQSNEECVREFGVAAGFSASVAVMGSPSSDTENLTEGMNVDELSLYTTPPQKLHYVEQEKGVMEENVTLLRNMAEPYITWCQLCHDGDSYVYLRNPPPEFYPRAGVIGFTGILGLFLARGSRMKRLIYPTGLMAVGASMYYPQKAATIAKSTGDAVYEFTLQAYVTVEKLITGKSAVKPEEKVKKAEEK
ncbi:MICOS complex subunit MIC26 [Silurus asotus]|uniref:MICOS complex subunit n=1 Tax=Silurus asotus TaxID=30991 RepID=A0AAD5AHQ6_SILAS|nr:MICOS complex subunit MIC26 [Silurus asotus]